MRTSQGFIKNSVLFGPLVTPGFSIAAESSSGKSGFDRSGCNIRGLKSNRLLLHEGKLVANGTPEEVMSEETLRRCYQADLNVHHHSRDAVPQIVLRRQPFDPLNQTAISLVIWGGRLRTGVRSSCKFTSS